MARVYMMVTQDEYELPLAIADSPTELAAITNTARGNIISSASKHRKGIRKRTRFVSVDIEDEGSET